MKSTHWIVAALLAVGLAGLFYLSPPAKPAALPAPGVEPTPAKPKPWCPNCPKKRWGAEAAPAVAGDPEPAVDVLAIPGRKPNISSRGLGCCVFRSLDYSARHQNVPVLFDFPEFLVSSGIEGGGYPSKVRDLIPRIAHARSQPAPRYIQYEGNDPSVIELALKTGRLPAITWNGNHMLNGAHLDAERGAIVDNNAPDRVQWFSRAEFLRRWTMGSGGWVVVLLEPGPPPCPRNLRRPQMLSVGSHRGANPCSCPPNCPACRTCCDIRLGCTCLARRPGCQYAFSGERFEVCGVTVSRRQFEEELVDDSARPHLTLVGGVEESKAALAGLPGLERYRVQVYRPDAWELKAGFSLGPQITVYLQHPDGSVLLRRESALGLAQALRRADPSYDPKRDPDGSALVSPATLAQLREYAPWVAGAAGAAGLLWLLARRQTDTGASSPARLQQPVAGPPAPPTTVDPQIDLERELGRRLIRRRLDDLLKEDERGP